LSDFVFRFKQIPVPVLSFESTLFRYFSNILVSFFSTLLACLKENIFLHIWR
jgi:hypothetical protein